MLKHTAAMIVAGVIVLGATTIAATASGTNAEVIGTPSEAISTSHNEAVPTQNAVLRTAREHSQMSAMSPATARLAKERGA